MIQPKTSKPVLLSCLLPHVPIIRCRGHWGRSGESRLSLEWLFFMGFGNRGSMENWAVERKKESNLRRNRLKCLRLGTSDRRLNGGVDNYSKNGNAGKRKSKSFMGIKRCRQEGAMRSSNAVDFKIPTDITMWPKHAG
jgi:hypothetical protein